MKELSMTIDVASALHQYALGFEAALPRFLPQGDDPVSQAMRYGMEAGGKRIRPALAVAFCELFGGKPDRALPFAAAVEMVHGYSLIHDDLPCMDDDDFRRGRPSCHKKFGEATALLAGDALLAEAFACIANHEFPVQVKCRAISVLAKAAGVNGMIGGQQLDMLYEKQRAARAQLEDMNRKKTGALLSAACLLGCVAAGAGIPQTLGAACYADALGLLFQITDDLLDADEEPGKATWVSLLGPDGARAAALEYAREAREAIARYAGKEHLLYNLPDWLLVRDK
jgi:geranylgeranyl diphosphate synthase type II